MSGEGETPDEVASSGSNAKVRRYKCHAPGPEHHFDHQNRGGRPPKYCPDHRRPRNVERSELAYQARQRLAGDMAQRAVEAREASQALRLAAGLRVFRDPVQAARLFGVASKDAELEGLAERARREHGELINGDMRETAHLAEAVVHVALLEVLERAAELPAREYASIIKMALDARQAFLGDGSQTRYTSITLGIVPPPEDGILTPEQIAKVRGGGGEAEDE